MPPRTLYFIHQIENHTEDAENALPAGQLAKLISADRLIILSSSYASASLGELETYR